MVTLLESYCSICNKELITRGGQLIMSPGCCDQFYHQTCMNISLVSLNRFSCPRCNISENESSKVKFQIFNLYRCKMSWPVCFRSKRYNTRIPIVVGTNHTAIAVSDNRMVQSHNIINNSNYSRQQLFNLQLANEDCMICLQSLQPNGNSNNTFSATNKSYCLHILCSTPHRPSKAIMSPGCCGKFYHQQCIQQMVKVKSRTTNSASSSLLCPNCRREFSVVSPLPLTVTNSNRSKWWLMMVGADNRRTSPHPQSSVTVATTVSPSATTANNYTTNSRNLFAATTTVHSTNSNNNNNNLLPQVLSAVLNQLGAFIQQQVAELNSAIRRVIYFTVELSLLVLFVLLFTVAVLLQKKSPIQQQ